MKVNSLILTAVSFALLDGSLPAQAKPTASAVADPRSLALAQGMRTRAGFRTDFVAAPVRVNQASVRRFPRFYIEDTPFATQVRVPVAHLLGGRLRFEAFYREISTNNIARGVAESSEVWRPMRGGLSLRPARSYGISLRFAFSDPGPKER